MVVDKPFQFIACLKTPYFHPCLWMLDQMQSFWVPPELQPVCIELCKYCLKFYYTVAKGSLGNPAFLQRNFFSLNSTYIHLYISLYLYCCGGFILICLLMYTGFTMCTFLLGQQSDSLTHIRYMHSFLHYFPLWFIVGYWLEFLVKYSGTLVLIHSIYKILYIC